ncbi:hypothetical protein H8959_011568 [Pygathrix nigripes]
MSASRKASASGSCPHTRLKPYSVIQMTDFLCGKQQDLDRAPDVSVTVVLALAPYDAVKCREERRCFTAASPRLEPRSAHRRQPRLQASRPRGERETLRTAALSAAPIPAPGDVSSGRQRCPLARG